MKDKGFTLIETLIAMVIGSLVALGIGIVVNVSTSQYKRICVESDMMMESQIFIDRLSNLLMCANDYRYYTDGSVSMVEIDSAKINDSNQIEETVYYIIVSSDTRMCYLVERGSKVTQPLTNITFGDEDFLAKNISSLSVSPISPDSSRSVRIVYDAELDGSIYTYTKAIKLRNDFEEDEP